MYFEIIIVTGKHKDSTERYHNPLPSLFMVTSYNYSIISKSESETDTCAQFYAILSHA